jgi:hypothetical protein
MDNEEIIEGNKLIAEFMGFPKPEVGMTYIYKRYNNGSEVKVTEINGDTAFLSPDIDGSKTIWLGHLDGRSDYNWYEPKDWGVAKLYHENWNALMPVVEKIREQGEVDWIEMYLDKSTPVAEFKIRMEGDSAIAEANEYSEYFSFNHSKKGGSLIDVTYQGTVAFIKWYNSNP